MEKFIVFTPRCLCLRGQIKKEIICHLSLQLEFTYCETRIAPRCFKLVAMKCPRGELFGNNESDVSRRVDVLAFNVIAFNLCKRWKFNSFKIANFRPFQKCLWCMLLSDPLSLRACVICEWLVIYKQHQPSLAYSQFSTSSHRLIRLFEFEKCNCRAPSRFFVKTDFTDDPEV